MHYRTLGSTDIQVSEIGFGTWAIGGLTPGQTSYGRTDDEASLDALHAALDLGINFFDTANIYGNGHSEELLGRAFEKERKNVIIASKCGMRDFSSGHDFSAKAIRTSVLESLARLRTDYLDLLQLHDPLPEIGSDQKIIQILEELRKEGLVRAIGVSVKSPMHGLQFLKGPWQTIQCNFNMIDQRALECELFSQAAAANISIITRTPLAFGFLSGMFMGKVPVFKEGDHRSRWSAEQIKLWADAPKYFAPVNKNTPRSLSQLAIQFSISFKGIASTIPGVTTRNEAAENAEVGNLEPLTQEEIDEVIRIKDEHAFYLG